MIGNFYRKKVAGWQENFISHFINEYLALLSADDKIASEKKIWDKWVQKDESGNPLKAKDEAGNTIDDAVVISNVDSFTKEMNDLMSVENEIPFEKLKFEELGLKTVKIKDLIKIDFLFDLE